MIALTLDCSAKWVDNLLSHHELPGVFRAKQGVQRRVSDDGLLAIELTRMLTTELGVPMVKAAAIARSAVQERTGSEMQFVTQSGLSLVFPISVIESRLRRRIVESIDSVGAIPRGRPPRGKARGIRR